MDIFGSSSITAASAAAQAKIASALAPMNVLGKATTSSSTVGKTTDPGTITSSDFLTLLVSELKNQDPTQPTDPNAYIQQLVGVNSLQQLIQINQGISTIEPATPPTTST